MKYSIGQLSIMLSEMFGRPCEIIRPLTQDNEYRILFTDREPQPGPTWVERAADQAWEANR